MEAGKITGLHREVSGIPVPLSASVTEEQLPELRVYTVATGEREVRQQSPLDPHKKSKTSLFSFKGRYRDNQAQAI